jgi:hypothetical protein
LEVVAGCTGCWSKHLDEFEFLALARTLSVRSSIRRGRGVMARQKNVENNCWTKRLDGVDPRDVRVGGVQII